MAVVYRTTGALDGADAGTAISLPTLERRLSDWRSDYKCSFVGEHPRALPLVTGQYSIGGPYYNPRTGPMSMNLTPINGNNALGRTLFRIHGDNAAHNHTASTGCIVEGANVRNRIANSNDNWLHFVP